MMDPCEGKICLKSMDNVLHRTRTSRLSDFLDNNLVADRTLSDHNLFRHNEFPDEGLDWTGKMRNLRRSRIAFHCRTKEKQRGRWQTSPEIDREKLVVLDWRETDTPVDRRHEKMKRSVSVPYEGRGSERRSLVSDRDIHELSREMAPKDRPNELGSVLHEEAEEYLSRMPWWRRSATDIHWSWPGSPDAIQSVGWNRRTRGMFMLTISASQTHQNCLILLPLFLESTQRSQRTLQGRSFVSSWQNITPEKNSKLIIGWRSACGSGRRTSHHSNQHRILVNT